MDSKQYWSLNLACRNHFWCFRHWRHRMTSPQLVHRLTFTLLFINIPAAVVLLLHPTSRYTIHLQWVPSPWTQWLTGQQQRYTPTPTLSTYPWSGMDLTDLLTNLRTMCRIHGDTALVNILCNTRVGDIKLDMWYHWWIHSSLSGLGHYHHQAQNWPQHLHRLGVADTSHCPWCPAQLDTREHLLLHCPWHYSHCVALLHSLSLHIHRAKLGGNSDPGLASKVIKLTGI